MARFSLRSLGARLPLRSLSIKLTLAFLLVGVIGAGLVAVLLESRARVQFDVYLSARDQAALIDFLAGHYTAVGSWDGTAQALAADVNLGRYARDLTVLDSNHIVVLGRRPFVVGQEPSPELLGPAQPIQVGDRVVGYVLFPAAPPGGRADPRAIDAERNYLAQLTWASAISAGVAVLIALVLGFFLARTLTRPIRELTLATRALAGGDLSHRVPVRSSDEIGQLAESFNQMGTDLERATRARQQMTADLAHDIRTPLSILRGYTEMLQEGRLTGNPTLYQIMHGEVIHLQHLVEDLRLLSLADAGALTLNRRPVDPTALLERTALAYYVQAEESGTKLRMEAPASLPSVSVDTERMTQVLNNLVSNSLRFAAGREIVLSASSTNGFVEIKVSDTGDGIPAEDVPYVFDRFYRGDPSRHRDGDDASGLGLAIARAIVEAHGGNIAASSTLGQGTTVTITLSALAPEPAESDNPAESGALV